MEKNKNLKCIEKLNNDTSIGKKILSKVPPMGWNSWNTFGGDISEEVIIETSNAMVDLGLAEAGYNYIVIDDGYLERKRDSNGQIVPDFSKFPNSFKKIADHIHGLGLKFGMYNSAGTGTCMGLAGSWDHEESDAKQFANWDIDYFKYDFCNNPIATTETGVDGNTLCPNIVKVVVSKGDFSKEYLAKEGILGGKAILNDNVIYDLGDNDGEVIFNIDVIENGEYRLSIYYLGDESNNKGRQIQIDINNNEQGIYYTPIVDGSALKEIKILNVTVNLNKGNNIVRLYNPFDNVREASIDGAIRSYTRMAKALNSTGRDILFSICEWGGREPWLWGSKIGHIWRTTRDITYRHGEATWKEVMKIYEENVILSDYTEVNGWNDPDMLVVGLDGLSYEENIAHFSLWCMMASPLMIGNDIRNMTDDIKQILTNKELIKLNQDPLGKQAVRIESTDKMDLLIKPLDNNNIAILVLNKSDEKFTIDLSIKDISNKIEDINLSEIKEYKIKDLWSNEEFLTNDFISIKDIPSHGIKTYRVYGKNN